MARPFSAALFLAAFRSEFYAEFWDGASPLSPSPPPNPRTECGFCSVDVAVRCYYHRHTRLIANRYCACAPVKNRQVRTARVACPMQAEHTHGCLRDNARSTPFGRISLVLFSLTGSCTPNVVSLDLTSIKGSW